MKFISTLFLSSLLACLSYNLYGAISPQHAKNKFAKKINSEKKITIVRNYRFAHPLKVTANKKVTEVKDGAPPGPIPKKFKPIHPKVEPLSKYGNPESYSVNGKAYQVMKSAGGYKSRGIASWYGTKFHSKRTSSGEDYDMYALTAAHRTLPLPSYVKVRNLVNGKEIMVKVNDRGPFHKDRLIDLSYAAAVQLGLFPRGTAPVEVEAINLTKPEKGKIAHYYIQAGAFSTLNLAYGLKHKLKKISPNLITVEKQKQRFVVKIGPLKDKNMTQLFKEKLATYGVTGAFAFLQD